MAISPEDFGSTFKTFMERMSAQAPKEEPFFAARLRDHFGLTPTGLPIVSEEFPSHDRPNLHLGLEGLLGASGRSFEVVGVAGQRHYMSHTLGDLVSPGEGHLPTAGEGPVEYLNVPLSEDCVLACVRQGLYLIRDGDDALAALVRENESPMATERLILEVMAADRPIAERFLHRLRWEMRERNVFRGNVLSLSTDRRSRELIVAFHALPGVDRSGIILPEGLLDRIERQTVGFARNAEKLLAAGRHLKRGVLLHGPPGTGKTLTAMYLAAAMRGRTVLLLTGRALGLLEQTCAMARALQPSTVILEDVDLIAEERTSQAGCNTALLFELLNAMDGLAEDADVLFLLTTNRPDLLEPALAARPGRVDLAVEVPLPDASCRRRLFDLYGRGLELRLSDPGRDALVSRTEGASAAFIRELMRRAALLAADGGPGIVVEDRHLDEALHELVIRGGPLTGSLLGFHASRAPIDGSGRRA